MGNFYTALGVFFTMLIILLIVLIAAIVQKQKVISSEKKVKFMEKDMKEYLNYVSTQLAYGVDTIHVPIRTDNLAKEVVYRHVLKLLKVLNGENKTRLIKFCWEAGYIDNELKKLGGKSKKRQLDAAYKLGHMKIEDASKKILYCLQKEKDLSRKTIFARALARCTRDFEYLIHIINEFSKNNRKSHNLLIDILVNNSNFEPDIIFMNLIKNGHLEHINIALMCLYGNVDKNMSHALRMLINYRDKEVMIRAAKALFSSRDLFSYKLAHDMLAHEVWEVRAACAKSLGYTGDLKYMDILEDSMEDENWWVRYNGARSLAMLGKDGFKSLCSIAISKSDIYKAQMAHWVINEELEHSYSAAESSGNIIDYNNKLFTYQRICNKQYKYS